MIIFLIGLLFIAFTKEYILINQELIIYITFLTITFVAIQSFSFLKNSFEEVRKELKTNLINISLITQKTEQALVIKAALTSTVISFIDISLPES